MSAMEEIDLGQAPIVYPKGFIKAVAENSHRNGHASSHESSGGSGSSSSNTSQTQLVQVSLEPEKRGDDEKSADEAVLDKERHPSASSSSARKISEAEGTVVQEYYCGVGRCRPGWMQKLRDARFFTFLLCCNCFIEGALVSGELVSVVDGTEDALPCIHTIGFLSGCMFERERERRGGGGG